MTPRPEGLLIEATPRPNHHECVPPHRKYPSLMSGIIHAGQDVSGALWQCDCGAYWHGDGQDWEVISPKAARRILSDREERAYRAQSCR